MTTEENRSPIFRVSAEAVRLERRFAEMKPGDFISYAEVREIIGFDPQSDRGRGITATARRRVLNSAQIAIGCVCNEGFKRMTDAEAIKCGMAHVSAAGKHGRRGAHLFTVADPKNLNDAEKIQQLSGQSICAVMAELGKPKAFKAIAAKVTETKAALPYFDAIIAMHKH